MKKLHSANKEYSNNFVFNILLFCLILLCIAPTSINGDFSKVSIFYEIANICFVLLFGFLYGSLNKYSVLMVTVLLFLYISFTVFTPFFEYSFGHSFSVLPILTLICFRFKKIPLTNCILWSYYLVVVFIFIIGYIPAFSPSLISLYESYYSYGYEGLISDFIFGEKPISIFGSHSYAGFFYFLIFILSWHLLVNRKNIIINTLILIMCFLSLVLIESGSSKFFLITIVTFFIVDQALLRKGANYFLILRFMVLVLVVVFYFSIFGGEVIITTIDKIVGDKGNGLLSRYSEGVLSKTIEYVSNNPLVGIGLGYSSELYYTDSDYIITALRLGIFGAILYFFAIIFFLVESIRLRARFKLSFLLIFGLLFFMSAMTVSTYVRIVPFLILTILVFDMGSKITPITKNVRK